MTAIPLERRLPSFKLALCIVAIPVVFAVGNANSMKIFLVAVLAQVGLYLCGIGNIRQLRTRCPRPATTIGKWFTGLVCVSFIIVGGLWCLMGLCVTALIATFGVG